MKSTGNIEILSSIYLARLGLLSGIFNREEIIGWSYDIIEKEEQPDIFFIDLALSGTKNINDILSYFNNYLHLHECIISVKPLFRILYKRYNNGMFNLEQTIHKLTS